jgi:hypothetical protein
VPDNTTEIEALEAVLNTGALQVTVDGQTIRYRDPDAINARIRQLKREDSTGKYREMKRPSCATIILGGS